MKTHFRNIRLRVNACMTIPECKARERLLDCDSSAWPTTGVRAKVTCNKCRRLLGMEKLQSQYNKAPK